MSSPRKFYIRLHTVDYLPFLTIDSLDQYLGIQHCLHLLFWIKQLFVMLIYLLVHRA